MKNYKIKNIILHHYIRLQSEVMHRFASEQKEYVENVYRFVELEKSKKEKSALIKELKQTHKKNQKTTIKI